MHVSIDDATKGTITLPEPIDNKNGHLKIGIRSIGFWMGVYNIYEEQLCRFGRSGEHGTDFIIEPGLYNFKEISRDLRKAVSGISLVLNKTNGLIKLSIPNGVLLFMPEAVNYMLGLDEKSWLQNDYIGDKPVEFIPAGGISIYLNQVSTTNNYSTNSGNIVKSDYLGKIPLLTENFGQFFSLHYNNPTFIDLIQSDINQLEFSFKLNWRNGVQHDLNNHSMPISLELEIK